MNVHGIDDPAPHWDVTSREVIRALAQANEMLRLPHSIHVHPNDLGHPGNFPTTVNTMDCLKDHPEKQRIPKSDHALNPCTVPLL